jgi:hypothetical protein
MGDIFGGWSCYVEQGRYGHLAKKATWLYAVSVELPSLRWGCIPDQQSKALVSWCGNHVKSEEDRPRVGKAAAAATPPVFADSLLDMARSVRPVAMQSKRQRNATPPPVRRGVDRHRGERPHQEGGVA